MILSKINPNDTWTNQAANRVLYVMATMASMNAKISESSLDHDADVTVAILNDIAAIKNTCFCKVDVIRR